MRLRAPSRHHGERGLLLLSVLSVAIAGVAFWKEFFPPALPSQSLEFTLDDLSPQEWHQLLATGQKMGRDSAPITIVEFSDFLCPACKAWWENMAQVRRERPDLVRIVYHHLPLEDLHPQSREAAIASECAARQGKFEPFHDYLYANQVRIEPRIWDEAARIVGVPNLGEFRRCIDDHVPSEVLNTDLEFAYRLGLVATPSVWANGIALTRPPDVSQLESILKSSTETKRVVVDEH